MPPRHHLAFDPDEREEMPELTVTLDAPDGYSSFLAKVDDDGY